MQIADRLNPVQASGIREVFDRAARLEDPINLSIGQPSFDVPDQVKREAERAMKEGQNQYTGTRGLPELVERLETELTGRTGVEPESTIVTAGVSGGLVLALLAIGNRGEQVLVPDPYFVSYEQLCHIIEAEPVMIDTYPDFKLAPDRLERCIDENTSCLLFNNPVNPTGVAYEREEVEAIAEVCRRHDIGIISDEIYARFTYDREHNSMITAAPERTVLLGGFSKTYGMPGWRVGWAAGPEDVLDRMLTVQQFSFVCAHTPSQHACVRALDVDMSHRIAEYEERRNFLCDRLDSRYDFVRPGGAFYLFPGIPGDVSGKAFVEAAFDRNLMVVPGNVFSKKDTHFRISYAVDKDELRRGVEQLNALAEEVDPK